ncbi:hypothetical protein RAMLITH_05475 [Ramlibacter sp. RBP-2]|uniref:SbsA Ig-like domain-containing protein n=1 Tax=Ramlibacter lithotrophicus TaxID=2606681 RepID=A0A7X6DDN2_9BURK|nr:Ig-like domain-containing protein [Ramlibacter lithotrophicus]NKE65264.1 hypothetical protein [Ramlibacter lithotrophicus]
MTLRDGGGALATTKLLAQRFDANGAKVGGEMSIGSGLSGWDVAAVAGGGWALMTHGIDARYGGLDKFETTLFDGSGAVVTSISSYARGFYPELATLANGTVLASNGWQFEVFDASGTPLAPPVDFDLPGLTHENFTRILVTPRGDGGFFAAWKEVDASNEPTGVILAQSFDAAGHRVGPPVQVPGTMLAATPEGGFLAAFEVTNAGTATDVQVQKFEAVTAPPPGSDTVAPAPIDFFPASGSNSLPPDWNLAITFDEAVQAGAGTITLRTAGGQVVQTFDVASDPRIRFNGASVIIDPAADLLPGAHYQLVVAPGAITDLAGNAYAGVSDYGFMTAGQPPAGGDAGAPVAVDFFPAAGSNTLPPDWNLAITFNEAVQAGAGTITLQTSGGQVVQTFDVASDPGIRFVDRSVVIDPAADLLPGTTYQLVVSPGAIQDLAGNAYAGVSDYGFTTAGQPPAGGDPGAPVAVDFFPAAGSNTLPPDWSLAITFNEAVQAGSGTITLQTAAGQVVQTFATATDPGIRFDGASVIIDPAADLQPGTTYQLVVSADAVRDLAGNASAGVSGHSFSTAGSAPPPGGDSTAPAAIDFFPAAGSNTLPPDWSLAITFDEDVQAGAGTITLQTAGGQVVQTFATATDPGIRFNGASVIIDPTADLQPGTTYQLVVSADAIEDLSDNAFAGVSGHAFTTAGTSTGPNEGPILLGRFPESKIPVDWNMSLTFNEAVKAGSGTITLETAAGDVVETFVTATHPGIQFSGPNVIINPTADLQAGTTYRLVVSPDAVEDLSGLAYSGVTFWPFTATASQDIVAPTATGFVPAPGSNTLPPDSNFTITFDEPVQAGWGTITLLTAHGDWVQAFTTATDAGIHFTGSSLVIDPANNLQPGTDYKLLFGPGAVEDLAGNEAAIQDYFFTTALVGVPPA